jgi:hypothetical protein
MVTSATTSEMTSALVSSSRSKTRPYHLSVKPSQDWLYRPFVSLNPNAIMITMGRSSHAMTTHVYACRMPPPRSRARRGAIASGGVAAAVCSMVWVTGSPPS